MQEGFDGALDVANRPPAPLAFSHTATLDQVVKNLSQKSKLKYFSRTESPGRDSARRDAVRLEVNPAPTSRTEPVAILPKTRFHSEKITINLKVKKIETSRFGIPAVVVVGNISGKPFWLTAHLDELCGSHLVDSLIFQTTQILMSRVTER